MLKQATKAKPHGVARVISKRGFCSRSVAENLVREGRVSLRGKIVRDPDTPAYENDEILVDGTPVTASDEKGRTTVMDIFREQYGKMFPGKTMPHIAPVGRLDAASEGLLLFTNDTKWADVVLCSADHLKVYRVQVAGKPSAAELKQMEDGFNVAPRVFGESEEFMHADRAALVSEGEKNCWLEITLSEGKNREIRRMLAHLGYEVMRLIRIQFDKYALGDLKPGEISPLNLR